MQKAPVSQTLAKQLLQLQSLETPTDGNSGKVARMRLDEVFSKGAQSDGRNIPCVVDVLSLICVTEVMARAGVWGPLFRLCFIDTDK